MFFPGFKLSVCELQDELQYNALEESILFAKCHFKAGLVTSLLAPNPPAPAPVWDIYMRLHAVEAKANT